MARGVADFVNHVLKSGLLTQVEIQEALRAAPPAGFQQPHELADFLVTQGKLSRFQSDKLLKGAYLGLKLGPYIINTPIGRGGMGTVYLALDTRSGQHVAVKVLPPKKARENIRYLARFLREMELSTKVRHNNIACTHDVGNQDGVNYIAMEYIPGQSLYRLVTKEGALSVPRAARFFSEIADALAAAHSVGLVHRDLKPSNVMVTPNDHAKVLDFGLAVIEGEVLDQMEVVGGKGYLVGSIDYIAPEQTENAAAVDSRADIYSLGCSLYFALAGQPPFPDGTKNEKIIAHRRQEPTPIRELNDLVPEKLARFLHRMLAKKPEQRIGSAQLVREELQNYVDAADVKPMDRRDDANYRKALRDLETAAVDSDIVNEELIFPSIRRGHGTMDPEERRRLILWVIVAIAGVWTAILVIGLMVWLIR